VTLLPNDPCSEQERTESRPRLLDLFCGAGGAAMGYHRAGFDVVGVDIAPQPNYPFEFWQQDALQVLREVPINRHDGRGVVALAIDQFDAIHASPPCQHYANVTIWRGDQDDHPDLIAPTRTLLEQTGLPWVMENVRTTALRGDFMLCGTLSASGCAGTATSRRTGRGS
jgi:DNA (cytosine-5)-methyltransferase 1